MEYEVENPTKSRSFGWGWTTQPTGVGTEIETPSTPDYTGTIKSICQARRDDKAYNSLGGAFYNTAWFYKGHRITHMWAFTKLKTVDDLPQEFDYDDIVAFVNWFTANTKHHAKNDKYGYGWIVGFDLDMLDQEVLKIRTTEKEEK